MDYGASSPSRMGCTACAYRPVWSGLAQEKSRFIKCGGTHGCECRVRKKRPRNGGESGNL
jgi:hypothetical protein